MWTFTGSILILFLTWNFFVQGYYISIPKSNLSKILPTENNYANSEAESNAQYQPQPENNANNNQASPQVISLEDLLKLLPAENNNENQEAEATEAKPQYQPQPESNAPVSNANNDQASLQTITLADLLKLLPAENNNGNQETEAPETNSQYQPQPESNASVSNANNDQASPQTFTLADLLKLLPADNNNGNQETKAPEANSQNQPQPESNTPVSNAINNQASPQAPEDNSNSLEITITILPFGQKSSEEKPTPAQLPCSKKQGNNDTALEVFHPQPTPQPNATSKSTQTEDNTQPGQQNAQPTIYVIPLTASPSNPSPQDQTTTNSQSSPYQQQNEPLPSNGTPKLAACCSATANQDDSQPTFELSQVTVSQILYHLQVEYEKLYHQQGDTSDSYEVLQMFLGKMLSVESEKVTVEDNKNIASTTYAAYYSTEYAYTFALCKLHNITGGPKNSEYKIDPKISSQCSLVTEKFTAFSVLYEKVISQTIASTGGQVLQYDDNNGSSTDQSSYNNPEDEKVSTSNNETIQRSGLEKDLHGYNDDRFYNRLRSEGNEVDQYDEKENQQIGNSTYDEETKGQKNDFSSIMISEIQDLGPKVNDPADEQKILSKSNSQRKITDQAVTQGHLENDKLETDSTRHTKYDRTDRKLGEEALNYFDDDNADIGGNIKNAKMQEVDTYQTSTVEHIQDVNGDLIANTFSLTLFSEQTTKYKNQDGDAKKYSFAEAVQKLLLYIKTVHVFISTMETNVKDKNNTSDGQGKDVYTEMYSSIYEQTVIYRRYLRKYFTNVNVENGTFNGTSDVDTEEVEMQTMQTSIQRFLWLQSSQAENQTDPQPKSDVCSNPLKLLWYFEEAGFYFSYLEKTQTNVPFMGYLPYPDFNVKTDQNNENGADVQFYLN